MVSFGSLIYVSADLDVQLILEVAQDLLDGAVDLLGVQFRLGIGQHQRESHALLALAQVLAAVDVEQAHPGDQGACAADGILDLAAGDNLIADQRQVALDRRKGADGAVVQFALHAAGQRLVVQLGQIDVLVFLLVLGDLELGVDLVGQLAKDAQPLVLAPDRSRDAGVQPGGAGLPLVAERQAQRGRQCFQRALDGKEVLLRAKDAQAEGLPLVGPLG